MRESKKHIEINIPNLCNELKLTIYEEFDNSLFENAKFVQFILSLLP
jgi:hypothetical protein